MWSSSYIIRDTRIKSRSIFTVIKPQNLLIDVSELHKIRGSADSEAQKLRNIRSVEVYYAAAAEGFLQNNQKKFSHTISFLSCVFVE